VDELMPLMAGGKVLPYLDIPFQHASPRILKLMRRPASAEKVLRRLQDWRRICPDIAVRSTFITGFPGETEAEYAGLLDFLREAELDRVGAFAYSPVDGAKANELPDPVPEELKEDRLEQFMAVQAEISAAKLQRKIGRTIKVLVDEAGADGAVARSAADAPEIDGSVLIADGQSLKPGQFVEVVVESASEHDLTARLAHPGLKII
jgi:ribosomal protein S12 methylthiotransferase